MSLYLEAAAGKHRYQTWRALILFLTFFNISYWCYSDIGLRFCLSRALREETAKREEIDRLRQQQEDQLQGLMKDRQDLEEFKRKQEEELNMERKKLERLEHESMAKNRQLQVCVRVYRVYSLYTLTTVYIPPHT